MRLLNLKKVEIQKKTGLFQGSFEAARPASYTFTENGLTITKTMEVFYKSVPVNKYEATIPNLQPVSNSLIEKYHFIQNSINYCINNAELINIQLRDLLLLIRSEDPNKGEIYSKDFMALRNLFSKYLNEDAAIRSLESFNTRQKRKDVTATFHQYITDRNIYTHGKLKLLMPDEIFFLDYILEKREPARAEVTKEIVQSFLDVSVGLKNTLSIIHSFVQRLKLGK